MGNSDNSSNAEVEFGEPRMTLAQATDALRVLSDGDHTITAIITSHPELGQAVLSYLSYVYVLAETDQSRPKMLLFNGKPTSVESRTSRLQPSQVNSTNGDSLVIRVRNGEPVGAFRLTETDAP